MIVAKQGLPIICSNGHQGGEIARDILQDDPLQPKGDFSLVDAGNHENDGHKCSTCGERITYYKSGRYKVHTSQGWIG